MSPTVRSHLSFLSVQPKFLKTLSTLAVSNPSSFLYPSMPAIQLLPLAYLPVHSNCFLQDYFFVTKFSGTCQLLKKKFFFYLLVKVHCLSGHLFLVFSEDCSSSRAYYILMFFSIPSPSFLSLDKPPYMTTLVSATTHADEIPRSVS